jgi:hypothetical protein
MQMRKTAAQEDGRSDDGALYQDCRFPTFRARGRKSQVT